jgi:ATP-dependent exoDNAse (exonuclease V) beta subunit
MDAKNLRWMAPLANYSGWRAECESARQSHELRLVSPEERQLLYVAMTRAKDHLDIIVPQRFFVHGG